MVQNLVPDVGITTLLVSLFLVCLLYFIFHEKSDHYPPGPISFPILGNVPQIYLSGSIIKFCEANRKRFGNVFTIQLGGHKRVVVSGYDNFNKLLIKNAQYSSTRSAKALSSLNTELAKHSPGIFWAPFPQWKSLRSMAISSLRDEGMGKAFLEPKIMEEIEEYIKHYIKPHTGTPISVQRSLSRASSNLISQMVLGQRFCYEHEQATTVIESLNEVFALAGKLSILDNIPLAGLFFKHLRDRYSFISFHIIRPFFTRYFDEHKQKFDDNNLGDVLDRYILNSRQPLLSADDKQCFSDNNCVSFCAQLYSAGTETTSTALSWALLYMCLYPEVLQKTQAEIDEHLGLDRCVTSKDRLSLPYTDSVLLEVLRKANIAPSSVPHSLCNSVEIDGKILPSGADILLNMTSVLYDETVFEEPDKFKPERYLTGDIALKKQRTIPFGIGRRACLGESLAKMEIFMFFVTFVQRYNMSLPDGCMATDEPVTAVVNTPKPYEIIFTAR
ncbi:cytochrome P450 2B9-like isoform X1 [Watersipora subatra]|uniref:cytochrome P450 2B9-like isoform X1 n=1 Tax=Watersipora subatra TaxID=2589382 RepID=UPI00355C380A